MRRILRLKSLLLLLVSCMLLSGSVLAQDFEKDVREGVLRIKFKDTESFQVDNLQVKSTRAGTMQTGLKSVDVLHQTYQVTKMERVFPYSPKFVERHRKHGLHLWYQISYDSQDEYKALVEAYSQVEEVAITEPVYIKKLEPYEAIPYTSTSRLKSSGPFDDPYLPDQWHYNNTGQTGGIPGADANIFKAWEITSGSSNVIVAVHDEGIDVSHEDLAANMWVNEAELNGVEGVDDDENGFVDDINGFNFLNYTGTIEPLKHGTHVAGTVSAVNNNDTGVAGVAGGSGNGDGAKIMACQILGNGVANIAHSYVYAADNGAVISQNSWGYGNDDVYEQSVLDAIDYFIAEAGNYAGSPMKGGVVIFASGNNNSDGKHYPGAYNKVIAVDALNDNNVKASYSNYGTWTDISAPGGDHNNGAESNVLSTFPHNTYGYLSGTSMACPHVSGIAALAVAKHGGSGFTNEELKNRILTGYDAIDELNPDYAGLLGAGAIDAEKVLEVNEQKAPEQITDLLVSSIAQDFINIEWIVPADADDNNPLYFDIYYGRELITESNLSLADKVRIKSEAAAGTQKTYCVENLLPVTEYFFAIVSVDRWGNESGLSNIVSGITNNGPDIDVSPTSLTATGDVVTNYTGSTNFTISNLDEGVLKWEVEARHLKQTLPYSSSLKPSFNVATYKPDIGREGVGEQVQSPAMPLEDMDYLGASYQRFVIGDMDTTITNSSAVKFNVSQDEGFNLTKVKMLIKQDLAKGPFVMEIYSGVDISNAKLLLTQEYSVSNYYNLKSYNAAITLTEQLYFEKGETFWIVFHAPSGNLYPLGVGMEANEDDSDNCMMSMDGGRNWLSLEEAIGDPRWVWATVAQSTNDYLGKYITLEPSNGEVLYNESTEVNISADGAELPNGTYNTNIIINTNDKDEAQVRIPLTFTVSGHKPQMVYDDIVDFGTVLYGHSKTIDVLIQNHGLGNFQKKFQAVTVTGAGFKTGYISKYSSIRPFTEKVIPVTFTPSSVGTFNGTLEMIDANGEKIKIYFNGVGAEPPVAQATPDTVWFNNVTIGDQLSGSFTLTNAGNYPMKYYMPAYADGSNMDDLPAFMHKFGYTSTYTLNDPTGADTDLPYVWNDISARGKDVQEHLKSANVDHHKVALGFEMPFYGQVYDSIYITDTGVLTFDNNSTFNSSGINYSHHPHGYISAWWKKGLLVGDGGGVFYKHQPGKLIVQYSRAGYYSGSTFYWADFQIHLFENGNIEYYFGDSNLSAYSMKTMKINVEDPDHKDMYMVNNGRNPSSYQPYNVNINLTRYSAVRIINPGRKLFTSLTDTFGIVSPGESVSIDYTMETAKLYEGLFYENVSIVSNDPFNNPVVHTAVIDINAGGVSDLSIGTESLEFGQVFQNGAKSMQFEISNTGSATEEITNVYLANGAGFAYNDLTGINLKAKTKAWLSVDMVTTTVGSNSDELVVENAGGELFRIQLSGEVIEAPAITASITALSDELNTGETSLHAFTVNNTGGNDLGFMMNANSWWRVYEDSTQTITSYDDMTYSYTTSYDENGPVFRWEDIVESGIKIEVNSLGIQGKPNWVPVELPFTFNFYGVDCDTIYIGENGIVNFTGDQGPTFSMVQTDIPNPEGINNYIAPLYSFGQLATYFDDKGGAYFEAYDDKFVVQWYEYMDNFGMGFPISVQLLLFPDGSMKFQYNEVVTQRLDRLGLIGIENEDGTKGVQLSSKDAFVADKLAVSLSPAKKFTVAPGTSKDFNLAFDAREAMVGTYTDTLLIESNDPLHPETKVSLDLVINGTNQATAFDSLAFTSIDMGNLMAYEKKNEFGGMKLVSYEKEFTIKNTGDTLLNINSGGTTIGSEIKLEYWYESFRGSYWKDISLMGTTHPVVYPDFNSWKFKVTVTPTGDTLADGTLILPEIKDTLAFNVSAPGGELKIPVNATIQLPPAMVTATDTLAVLANTSSHVETKSFTITNNGLSPLDYSLKLAFKREADYNLNDVVTNSTSGMIMPVQQSVTGGTSTKALKVEGYDNTLEYDTQSEPTTALGYGGSFSFVTATEFIAPEAGFILSHIMTWYRPGELLNSVINYEIRTGNTLESSTIAQTGTYNHDINTVDNVGSFLTMELQNSVLFRPLEKFWVVYKYQIQATHPQGVANTAEDVKERFHFGTGDGTWYDIIDGGGSGMGWMVKALEKTHYETAWAKILGPVEGSIPVGETVTVEVAFDASFATDADSYAEVVVASNDPENRTDKVELYLRVNQGPEIAMTESFVVNENETLTIDVHASDMEGDDFTLSMTENYEFVTTDFNEGVLTIKYTPDFESAGMHMFEVKGEDVNGNINTSVIQVEVVNVNRAPELISTIEAREYYQDEAMDHIDMNAYFSDPDGEELSYDFLVSDISVANIYTWSKGIMIEPMMDGQAEITVIASDLEGLSSESTFNLTIGTITGIEDVEGTSETKVYPVPTTGPLNVVLGSDIEGEVSISILNVTGLTQYQTTLDKMSGEHIERLNISNMPSGIYLVKITSAKGDIVKRVVKM